MYESYRFRFFGNWGSSDLRKLFILAAAFSAALLLSSLALLEFTAQNVVKFPLYGYSYLFAFPIPVSLFLLAFHVHSMMVRSESSPLERLRPLRGEFDLLIEDIISHSEFRKLEECIHHTSHRLDHVLNVAYLSYIFSKVLSLDFKASARGGLLHDFFLYDWRERKNSGEPRRLHGEEHPHIALSNAQKHFTVGVREQDIIVKHMFPKTRSLPRYPESFIVSLCDKFATVYEYLKHLRTSIRKPAEY